VVQTHTKITQQMHSVCNVHLIRTSISLNNMLEGKNQRTTYQFIGKHFTILDIWQSYIIVMLREQVF